MEVRKFSLTYITACVKYMYIQQILIGGTQNLSHIYRKCFAWGYAKPFLYIEERFCVGVHKIKEIYSQGDMRSHFIRCLENGLLTPFLQQLELVWSERLATSGLASYIRVGQLHPGWPATSGLATYIRVG